MEPRHINRRKSDYLRLQELCAQSGGRIAITSITGTRPTSYEMEFTGKMLGPTASGPHGMRRTAKFSITLPPNYPDPGGKPEVMSIGPIWHPHFFGSGQLCKGNAPLTFLDTFVTWLWQTLVLDPSVNSGSAANTSAKSGQMANAMRLPLDTPDVRVPAGSVPAGSVPAGSVPDLVPVQAVSVSAPTPAVASPRLRFRDAGDPSPSITRVSLPVTARISWR